MRWYHYIECFFAGLFLANFVPHFVHGISGESFPSPFSNPVGEGMSKGGVEFTNLPDLVGIVSKGAGC